jgi:antitoxin VapB
MTLSIKDEKADRLARELARRTGESLTEAVTRALEERLTRVAPRKADKDLIRRLNAIAKECAALPELDSRSAEEIIGYDENGLPR